LTALEINDQRLNNSVSLFFSKTISLTRQRKKVRPITVNIEREYIMRSSVALGLMDKLLFRKEQRKKTKGVAPSLDASHTFLWSKS